MRFCTLYKRSSIYIIRKLKVSKINIKTRWLSEHVFSSFTYLKQLWELYILSHSKTFSPQSHQWGNSNQVYICMFPSYPSVHQNVWCLNEVPRKKNTTSTKRAAHSWKWTNRVVTEFYLFPKRKRENIDKIHKRTTKLWSSQPNRIRESIMQGEGINTSHVRCTQGNHLVSLHISVSFRMLGFSSN